MNCILENVTCAADCALLNLVYTTMCTSSVHTFFYIRIFANLCVHYKHK